MIVSALALEYLEEACSVARVLQPSVVVIEAVDPIAEDRDFGSGASPLLFQLLNESVRNTPQFVNAEAAGKLVRIPTGDGMALIFFTSVDTPVPGRATSS